MQGDDFRAFTCLRSLNPNIQTFARRTVGILVDNVLPSCARNIKFSHGVTVVFLGGPDNREALAFGSRISCRAGIKMTSIHTLLNHRSDQGQKKLGDSILGEFKSKNIDNARAVYHELVVATDGMQVVNIIIESLELDYNLVTPIPGHQPVKRIRII